MKWGGLSERVPGDPDSLGLVAGENPQIEMHLTWKPNFLKSLATVAAAARAPCVAPPPRAATHSKPWQQMQAPVAQPSQAAPGQAQAQAQEQPTGARRGRKRGAQAVDQLSFKKECAYAVALNTARHAHQLPCMLLSWWRFA